jgi:hypothetical protein
MATFIKTGFWEKARKGYKEWLNLDELIQSLAPPAPEPAYKVYTALLTQTGTNAPVATVLENTIGAITIMRSGTGEYRVKSSGLFTLNKTTFDIAPILGFIKQDQFSNINEITFITRNTSNITSDGLLTAKKLEIRVYN